MLVRKLALAGTAAAALSVGVAAPALAHTSARGHGGGCHHFCVATVSKGGVKYGTVKVFVGHGHIRGVLHLTRDAKKGTYGIRGHCKPVGHHEGPAPMVRQERVVRERTFRERPVFFTHHQVRSVPKGSSSTGFGGTSDRSGTLPLLAGGLSLVTGGLALGGLALRRRSAGGSLA